MSFSLYITLLQIIRKGYNMNDSQLTQFDCTVIVTCFNSAKTIAKTLESVLNQHLSPSKLIVVDDCSTDNSREVISKFPCQIYKTPENLGCGAAKLFGSSKVNTEFIVFLDSDDTWDADFLELQAKYWVNSEKNLAAIGFALRIGPGRYRRSYVSNQQKNTFKERKVELTDLRFRNPFTSSATVYRNDALNVIGGYSSDSPVDDFETIVRLSIAEFDLLAVPIQCGEYGISATQISSNPAYQLQGQLRVLELVVKAHAYPVTRGKIQSYKRILLLRSVAKCANFRMSSKELPKCSVIGDAGTPFGTLYNFIENPIIWCSISKVWRFFGVLKSQYFKLRIPVISKPKRLT